jgi:hypothetical protein
MNTCKTPLYPPLNNYSASGERTPSVLVEPCKPAADVSWRAIRSELSHMTQ